MFLSPNQIHYFRDIGYQHSDIHHCPVNALDKQLPCPTSKYNTTRGSTEDYWDAPRLGGLGCRCTCPTALPGIEDKDDSCIADWVRVSRGYADGKGPELKQRYLRRREVRNQERALSGVLSPTTESSTTASPSTSLLATYTTVIISTPVTSTPTSTSGLSTGAIGAIAGSLGGVVIIAILTAGGLTWYKLKTRSIYPSNMRPVQSEADRGAQPNDTKLLIHPP
jgi:hypothetical protein